jgi:cytidine deaminase
MPITDKQLRAKARETAMRAYAPYSNFFVGAAALFDERDDIYLGTNVENVSFGLTMCAERSAIAAGIAADCRALKKIAIFCIVGNSEKPTVSTPCGACRQVIAEFGKPDTEVLLSDGRRYTLSELLPNQFMF